MARLVLLSALFIAANSEAAVPAGVDSSNLRYVYFVRHGEAFKNTVTGPSADDPANDQLTPQGLNQVMAVALRLSRAHLTAVATAAERRTQQTAVAITLRCLLPSATVDADLVSKRPNESQEQRVQRGLGAVRRFLGSTHGDVAIVSHGHILNMMATRLVNPRAALNRDVLDYELVNAGITSMVVDVNGTWRKVGTDELVNDGA